MHKYQKKEIKIQAVKYFMISPVISLLFVFVMLYVLSQIFINYPVAQNVKFIIQIIVLSIVALAPFGWTEAIRAIFGNNRTVKMDDGSYVETNIPNNHVFYLPWYFAIVAMPIFSVISIFFVIKSIKLNLERLKIDVPVTLSDVLYGQN